MAIKPKVILEIGTYLGYSSISMGRLLSLGCKLISLDVNPETTEIAKIICDLAGLNTIN